MTSNETRSTLPLTIDLPIYTGATLQRQWRWRPDGITPRDFTGWTGTCLIGPHRKDPTLTLTAVGGGLVLGPDGLITLHLDADETADLVDIDNFYLIDLTDAGGTVTRFLRGYLTIVKDFE